MVIHLGTKEAKWTKNNLSKNGKEIMCICKGSRKKNSLFSRQSTEAFRPPPWLRGQKNGNK